jgi:hypothetical protein
MTRRQKFLDSVPLGQILQLVRPDQPVKLRLRTGLLTEIPNRLNRVTRSDAFQFTIAHRQALFALNRTPYHRQPVRPVCRRLLFVRTLTRRHKDQPISPEHLKRMSRHTEMSVVNRIEGSSEQDDFRWLIHVFLSQILVKIFQEVYVMDFFFQFLKIFLKFFLTCVFSKKQGFNLYSFFTHGPFSPTV